MDARGASAPRPPCRVRPLLRRHIASDFRPRTFPKGPWIAACAAGTEREAVEDAPRANDGIVPASSQTLDGRAARIVLADHLDVDRSLRGALEHDALQVGRGHSAGGSSSELWRFVAEAL